ncbi:MAG: YjfB family protein [Spirochaetaceae bacterium]|jgi:hypothetical protein|nr:YjfB family protein [Spirochaetaceae bacterium]
MQIQDLSVAMSQENVQEQAAIKVAKMAMGSVEAQSDAMTKLLNTLPPPLNDPNLGTNLDFLA